MFLTIVSLSMSSPTVRYASKSDVGLILSLIKELAEYEKAGSSVQATEEKLLSSLSFLEPSSSSTTPSFTPGHARTFLIFAPEEPSSTSSDPSDVGQLQQPTCAGIALFFNNYSTWTAQPGIYLEDLFIRPQYRRRGYATLLFQQLAKECERINGARLEWSVLKWNKPSIEFYETAIGAKQMEDWQGMRVDGDDLKKLAQGRTKG